MTKNKKTVELKKSLSSGKTAKTEKVQEPLVPQLSEYNGKPTLILNPDSKYLFQFGMGKAKMIVECFDTIKAFVDSEGTSLDADDE